MNQLNLAGVLLSLGLGIYLFVSQSSLHDKVDKLAFDFKQAGSISNTAQPTGDTSQMILPSMLGGEDAPAEIHFPEAFFCMQLDQPISEENPLDDPAIMYFDGRGSFAIWEGFEKLDQLGENGPNVMPKLGKVEPTYRGSYALSSFFVFAEFENAEGVKRRRRFDVIYFQKSGFITHLYYKGKYYNYFSCSWNKDEAVL